MEREEALKLVKKYVNSKNLIKHMIATEAVMKKLAAYFNQDREVWGLAGLLHDIDYDQTVKTPQEHGVIGAQILASHGVREDIITAVKAHNEVLNIPRNSLMEKALYATDPVTGFIVAAALVHPDKKLASLDLQFLLNRFKKKDFARGANRQQMRTCEDMGLSLEKFLNLALEAMQDIAEELEL